MAVSVSFLLISQLRKSEFELSRNLSISFSSTIEPFSRTNLALPLPLTPIYGLLFGPTSNPHLLLALRIFAIAESYLTAHQI